MAAESLKTISAEAFAEPGKKWAKVIVESLTAGGVTLAVQNEIPPGVGLGSSKAMARAVANLPDPSAKIFDQNNESVLMPSSARFVGINTGIIDASRAEPD